MTVANPKVLVWMQGPTSAGKTTLAELFVARSRAAGMPVIHFDGDEIRDLFPASHGFAAGDRLRVVRTLVHFANKSIEAGLNVVVSALTAHEEARAYVKANAQNLITAYVACSIEECANRDPKGLYAKSARGEIDTLIGVDSPYVPPADPDIVLETERFSPDALVSQLADHLAALQEKTF